MDRQATIVVTGAAGMIGSGVVRHLNNRGYSHLLLVDDLGDLDKWKNLLGKQFDDLISPKILFEHLDAMAQEVGAIIHLGACSDTEEKNADYLLENNYRYSMRLAEWAFAHGARFIYASSAATYGDGAMGFSDDEETIERLKPLNMYGFSKHLFDLWLKRTGGLKKAVGLKYFNVFGPNEYHKGRMASMVLKMMGKALANEPIRLYRSNDLRYKDGEQLRDFIYAKDAVRMTCDFLEPKYWDVAGLFNIGRGQATSWNQLSMALFGALRQAPRIEYVEMPELLARQYQNFTCADMKKYRAIFSDFQTQTIESSVEEYVQKYLLPGARW